MGLSASRRRRTSVFPAEVGPRARNSTASTGPQRGRSGSDVEFGDATDIKAHLCGADPITARGKQIQMIQMLTIPMIPALLLLIHSAIYLSDSLTLQAETKEISAKVASLGHLAELTYTMQQERLALILFDLHNDTVTWYTQTQLVLNATDRMIDDLDPWPETLTKANVTHDWVRSPDDLKALLEESRDSVHRLLIGADQILELYDEFISVLISVMEALMRQTNNTAVWRVLFSYVSLIKGMESISGFSAIGEMVLLNIPLSQQLRLRFISSDVIGIDYVRKASLKSSIIKELAADLPSDLVDPTPSSQILKLFTQGTLPGSSMGRGLLNQTWVYNDALRAIEKAAADDIQKKAGNEMTSAGNDVAAALTTLILTLIFTPVIFMLLTRMMTAIQNYVLGLYKKGLLIRREKKKSDGLLYQMLPKSVALQLKVMKRTSSETFRSVTIFFSDIVGFTAMSSRSTPLQVVDCLNTMYHLFDSTIDMYDVFKVETIGDAYMVASGVPQRNGHRHAGEIAQLALDLLEGIRVFKIPHLPEEKLRIRIGIHTGSVVAGVVGSKMPRYCLFGDTVTYASLMESLGVPMKIQISPACNDVLTQLGGYLVESRGNMEVKGYGETETFFLRGLIRTMDGRRS